MVLVQSWGDASVMEYLIDVNKGHDLRPVTSHPVSVLTDVLDRKSVV